MSRIFGQINNYLRMIKFSHTIFALPFAGIAFLQAMPGSGMWEGGVPTLRFFILLGEVVVCMVTLRSAAMGFNRLVDREIDKKNPRTAGREIPSGVISVQRTRLFIALSLIVFVATAFFIHSLAGLLSPVAILIVLGYSYTKRFTFFAHYVLGLGIGLAPTATWIAIRGDVELLPILWTGGLMFYIAGFDILYSCQDAEFDKSEGLHSIPSRFGVPTALWIARISHLVALSFFVAAGRTYGSGVLFTGTVVVVALLFLWEHLLVRPGHLSKIPIAFFHINAIISTVLFFGLLGDLLFT